MSDQVFYILLILTTILHTGIAFGSRPRKLDDVLGDKVIFSHWQGKVLRTLIEPGCLPRIAPVDHYSLLQVREALGRKTPT